MALVPIDLFHPQAQVDRVIEPVQKMTRPRLPRFLGRLADRAELVVRGHDPSLVLERFTPVRPDREGIAVRLER